MTDIRSKEFDGNTFKFTATDLNASYFTFEDEENVRVRHWHVKDGEVVIDLGPAFGSYVLPALAAGARVLTFEPDASCRDLLSQNLALNPGFTERCQVLEIGIHGKAGFFDPMKSTFHHEASADRIAVIPLDECPEALALDRIDWLKMDIEGAELFALRGAEKLIRKHKPKILVENHQFHDKNIEGDVRQFVLGLGLDYMVETHPHHAVSHSFFWIP